MTLATTLTRFWQPRMSRITSFLRLSIPFGSFVSRDSPRRPRYRRFLSKPMAFRESSPSTSMYVLSSRLFHRPSCSTTKHSARFKNANLDMGYTCALTLRITRFPSNIACPSSELGLMFCAPYNKVYVSGTSFMCTCAHWSVHIYRCKLAMYVVVHSLYNKIRIKFIRLTH